MPHSSRNDLEQLAAALEEQRVRRREDPSYYYDPVPKLRDFVLSRAPVVMAAGGNRTGKSDQLIYWAGCQAIGYFPFILREQGTPCHEDWWERPDDCPPEALAVDAAGVRLRVPNTGLITTGLSMKAGIADSLHPKLLEQFGPAIEHTYMGHANTPLEVRFKNGSRIIYASAQQKGLAFESTNHTWYANDEPIPKRLYTGQRRGAVDQDARVHFAFTPLGQHAAWMFRELYRHADGKSIDVHNISIYDNPYLSPAAIDRFANDPTISDVEKQARLYGKFLHLVDRIYPQFNEDVHVIPPFSPDPSWFHGCAIDPHTVRPWAIAWFVVTPRGDVIFYREWPTGDFTKIRRDTRAPAEYAALLRQIEGTRPVDMRIMDPNYGPRSDFVRGTYVPAVRDVLAEYGLLCNTSLNDDLNYGEARVRSLLSYDSNRPLDDLNRPRFFVTENCRNIRNALSYYVAANQSAEDDSPSESKRDETYKDFADVVRYTAVSPAALHAVSDSWLEAAMTRSERNSHDATDHHYMSYANQDYE